MKKYSKQNGNVLMCKNPLVFLLMCALTILTGFRAGMAAQTDGIVSAIPIPVPAQPPNKAVISTSSTVSLSWRSVIGVTSYRVQVAADSTFAPKNAVVVDSVVTGSSLILSGLPTRLYYWRVMSNNLNGGSPWSTTRTFSTSNSPLVTILQPANGARVDPDSVSCSWLQPNGVSKYELQVSKDPHFNNTPLVDTTVQTTSVKLSPLPYGTAYHWRVRAYSNAGETWDAWTSSNFYTKIAGASLRFPVRSGNTYAVNAVFGWKRLVGARFYQIQIAIDSSYDSIAVDSSVSSPMDSITIDSLAPNTTFFWHVRGGSNSNGWGPYSPAWVFTVEPRNEPTAVSVSDTVDYPHHSDISHFKPEDFRLFGLPGATGPSIGALLKGIPGNNWEAYVDNGDTLNYLVKYDSSNVFDLGSGHAFWLIHNGTLVIRTMLSAAPLDSIGQTMIPLHPGWNIITDPFMVDVPWDTVQAINGIVADPIWAFNKGFNTSPILSAFQGYYFFNSDTLKALAVPYMGPNNSADLSRRNFNVSAANSGWTIHVKLVDDGIEDTSTWLGVSRFVSRKKNRLDVRKPSAFGFEPTAYFYHPGWYGGCGKFASEIHPSFSDSSSWTMTVDAVPDKAATLAFYGLSELPNSFVSYLYDHANNSWVNVGQSRQYSFVPKSRTTTFTVLVGRRGVVDSVESSIAPRAFRLDVNYPNPFNPTTMIGYQLSKSSFVNLSVYDVLGQKVATLVNGERGAGEHSVEFDGADFASGVYFYRLVAGGHVFTRKMVLLK